MKIPLRTHTTVLHILKKFYFIEYCMLLGKMILRPKFCCQNWGTFDINSVVTKKLSSKELWKAELTTNKRTLVLNVWSTFSAPGPPICYIVRPWSYFIPALFFTKTSSICRFPSQSLLTDDFSALCYGIYVRALRMPVHHFIIFIA